MSKWSDARGDRIAKGRLQPEPEGLSINWHHNFASLRVRAAEHCRSMEAEAREILRQAVGTPSAPQNLGHSIHAKFAASGSVDPAPVVRTEMSVLPGQDGLLATVDSGVAPVGPKLIATAPASPSTLP